MKRNELYPIFLKVHQLQVLVIGGGEVALEKLSFLFKSSPDARVVLVATSISPEITAMAGSKALTIRQEAYALSHLEGVDLVIACTDNEAVNIQVYHDCRARNILVNVADNPPYCDFYMGGIVTKGHLKIAISTNGKSPTIAKRLRQFFEDILPENIDELLESLDQYRQTLTGSFKEKVTSLNLLTRSLIAPDNDRRQ